MSGVFGQGSGGRSTRKGSSLRRRSTNDELGAITLSAGYAAMRADDEATTLIERADAALYLSKRNGRNCISNADQLTQAA